MQPPSILADDRGFTLGDGLFETVLALDGELRHLDAHLDRLAAGCGVLGLPAPDRAHAEALMSAALADAELAGARAAVRLTYTAGSGGRGLDRPEALSPLMIATTAAAPKPAGPATLFISTVRRNDGSPVSRLKSLAYLDNVLARAEAKATGADEALMLNTQGQLACAGVANIFWVKGGVLHTPDLACGVLAGVARARLMAAAPGFGLTVKEVRAGPEALADAESVFLTNSLMGLRPVSAVDGRGFAIWEAPAGLEDAVI